MGSFSIWVVLVMVVLYSVPSTDGNPWQRLLDDRNWRVAHRIGRALPAFGPRFRPCPPGFVSGIYKTASATTLSRQNVDRCYKTFPTVQHDLDWSDAREMCMGNNMQLPMPRYEAENRHIARIFGTNKYGYLDFWKRDCGWDCDGIVPGMMFGSGPYWPIPDDHVTDYYNWAPNHPDILMNHVRMSSVDGKWSTCQRDDWNDPNLNNPGPELHFVLVCERQPERY